MADQEHRQVTYRLLLGDKARHNYLFRQLCEQQKLYNAELRKKHQRDTIKSLKGFFRRAKAQ